MKSGQTGSGWPATGRLPYAVREDEAVTLDRDGLCRRLESSPDGLSTREAQRRLRVEGSNELPSPPGPSAFRVLVAQLAHTLALLLWGAAALAFLAGLPQLASAVVAIVLLNGAFSFWQEYRAGHLVRALHQRMPSVARVYRDRIEHRINARELVPGDLIAVQRGDRVPADARLLRAADLRLDYSIVTGESEPVSRVAEAAATSALADARNCVLAGTTVLEGTGLALVFATGAATAFGQVALMAGSVRPEPSPLQRELAGTARTIAVVAALVGVSFIALGSVTTRLSTEDAFIFGLGILVALIPEGLLPTVSLALAHGVQRMAHRNAIVGRLSSVETLGCTDVICTDKTGTITVNEMTAREVWVGESRYTLSGRGYSLRGALQRPDNYSANDEAALRWFLRCAVLCNNGIPPQPRRHRAGLGDPLDEALLVLAMKAEVDPDEERRTWPRLREYPFDAERRLMSALHGAATHPVLFAKGGPAEVLTRSEAELRDSVPLPLEEVRRHKLLERADEMSGRGLRVLALAYREMGSGDPGDKLEAEHDLVFLGLVGLDNPLRPEVPAAVGHCRLAGIKVVMLTGDYPNTALAVAREAGIAEEGAHVVTGAELETMGDQELDDLLAKEQPSVFARVTPQEKLRLVHSYQRLQKVVAVTGDGVNDAPALRSADIGIAMGKRGTDVAREAADMVLMDDNFATIVAAVEEGRAVYSNIHKFLTYFLTSNVAEAAPFVLFVLAGVPLPLTVLQILLVDLGTNVFPGLALGVDPPERGIMRRPPRLPSERMAGRGLLLRALAFLGVIAAALSLAGYFTLQWDVTGHLLSGMVGEGPIYREATTMTLAGIVACQVGNVLACRSDRESVFSAGLFGNRVLLLAVAAELALLTAAIGVAPLRDLFKLEPIEPRYWPVLAAFPPLLLAAEEARKYVARRLTAPRAGA